MMRVMALGAVAALALIGCSGASVEPAGNPVGPAAFTLPVSANNLAAANLEAAKHCRGQGRTAQLLARTESSAYYNCVR